MHKAYIDICRFVQCICFFFCFLNFGVLVICGLFGRKSKRV
jgi:hypothetical protein